VIVRWETALRRIARQAACVLWGSTHAIGYETNEAREK